MSMDNTHSLTLTGTSLPEICIEARQQFADYFGNLPWEVADLTAFARGIELKGGAGQRLAPIHIEHWEVTMVAVVVPGLVISSAGTRAE